MADDIELLRLFIADPAGNSQFFTADQLQELLDDNEADVYAAASDAWRIKAANVSDWYTTQLDGSLLSRDQVFDHCMKMVEHFSVLGGGGGTIDSVLMTTQVEPISSEF
jgi:hypothetical protein